MIAFIKGELEYISEECIIVEAGGIGYQIRIPSSLLEELPNVGDTVRIHTYLYVREDAMNLYGFSSRDDLNVFKLLITVNGIGPKAALGILSTLSTDELRFAVLSDDAKAISKAPGIGPKTASKLILELKDKLKLEDAFESKLAKAPVQTELTKALGIKDPKAVRSEAVQALVALGYSNTEALKAVREVLITETTDVEDVLKQSLKKMSLF
ncbi:MAG: Holliday junction branch migration protein RuvA [bacterium]|nr:Holliday junction branch migration protein RuvA [bacterium]